MTNPSADIDYDAAERKFLASARAVKAAEEAARVAQEKAQRLRAEHDAKWEPIFGIKMGV